MIVHCAAQTTLEFFDDRPIIVEPSSAQITSDAGLLPIRELDERLGLTEQFAAVLLDPRDGPALQHSFLEMTRSRVFGILAGYEDQNDHDALRSDPVFKLIAGRSPEGDDLASQPTLSRFENAIDWHSLMLLEGVLLDQFVDSFDQPPSQITLDLDTFDDPVHGQQTFAFYHGYYGQYQYQPRLVTCAENDLVVMAALLHGTAAASLAAAEDLERIVVRLRAAWPDVRILIRADSGFAVPEFYLACERLNLEYTIGLKGNPRLNQLSQALLEQAQQQFEATGQPQRLFDAFWYQAGSWTQPRYVVVKAEVNSQGTNRRYVVTNRPGAQVIPQAAYDDYAERGESENRNKELKCGLSADRLSDHSYRANFFRLYMHCLAANLLVRLRQVVAAPPSPPPSEEPAPEALTGRQRRRWFNHRRREDPLGEAQPDTWRTYLIKVAAEVVVTTRRVLVRLSGSWPYLDHYFRVSEAVRGVPHRTASGFG